MATNMPFYWGSAGQKLTPDQLARRREIEDALLAKGPDFSPVADPLQGFARVANAAAGAFRRNRLGKAETENAEINKGLIANLLAGGSSAASPASSSAIPMSGAAGEIAATSPGTIGNVDPSIRDGIVQTANALGIDPVDLATAISYETAGTFDPTKTGPTTKYGQHRGFIQFGEPQARQHGVNWDDPINSQLGENGAVASYLRAAGVKPGMGLLDIYSAINAGGVGRYSASDAAAGGAPGTVADKVNSQMAGHRAKALAFIGEPRQVASFDPSVGMPPGTSSEAVTAMGAGGAAPVSLSEEVAAYQQTPEYAARFPGRQQLRPFRPGETRPNPDGSYSTEITTTWQLPDGSWVNVPSLWMGANGPQQFSPDDEGGILGAMQQYEAQNGPTFQRFGSEKEAVSAAEARSSAGGAGAGPPLVADFSGSNQLSNAQGGIVPALVGGVPASTDQIARAQAAAQAPIQVAGGGDRVPMAPASTGINPAIIEALTNPQASEQTQRIAGILLQQEQARQNASLDEQNWRARQAYEQELLANDPLRLLQIQKAQQELDRGQPLINAGDGAIYDPNTAQWLNVPGGSKKAPQVVELFDEATGQPYKATWNAETGQYERVGGVKARSGMQLTTNPDGTVTLTEGAIGGLPKLTEAEGRNSGFYGRGVESQKILNSLEGEGTSLFNKVVGGVPVVGNYLKGEDAQKYGQAKRDFINAVLRRESGAVISPEEFANADQQYFPQPGDGPEVIEQKRQNRETTIQGLKISAGQGAAFAVPSQQEGGERKRLKFNPATGELE